uniref:Uncharacterized protein n=1 Tax=Salix viminalis TaxID=40686 RepID=A0A6N2MDJ3_SALVM
MGHFSAIFSCFVPSASSRVTDEAHDKAEKPKTKSKSSGAPIVVSYFPTNSFFVSSSSSRVTDEARDKTAKPKTKSKPSGAPIVVSYFPSTRISLACSKFGSWKMKKGHVILSMPV